jgi:hypothetical protein
MPERGREYLKMINMPGRGRPRLNQGAQPVQVGQAPEVKPAQQLTAQPTMPKPVQDTPEAAYWKRCVAKGFGTGFFNAATWENLENPNADYVSIGFKEANGIPCPAMAIVLPKKIWLEFAEALIGK